MREVITKVEGKPAPNSLVFEYCGMWPGFEMKVGQLIDAIEAKAPQMFIFYKNRDEDKSLRLKATVFRDTD